ncbi:MAG: LysR family transcriptional regulator [Desulfovibrio sp.]|nr:LysR family transcriptional regulator [Desulfovibrio sp.]
MELYDLRAFVSVVEHGSVTRAARELNRVPSGITTRIMQLEDYLGVKLFLREKKRLLITPLGQTFYEHAKRVLDLMSEGERQVKNAGPGGKLRIGAMESTAAVRLPERLAALHNFHPAIELELITGTSRGLYQRLLENQLDVIFAADVPQDGRVERVPVFEERLVVIAPAGHEEIREPSDMACKTLLAFAEGCSYRNRLLSWCRSHGMAPEKVVELSSYHAIMAATAAGMGAGIVPDSVLDVFPNPGTLAIFPMEPDLGRAVTELLWRAGMFSPNIQALKNVCARPKILPKKGGTWGKFIMSG